MRDTAHTQQLFEEQVESSFFSNLSRKEPSMDCGSPTNDEQSYDSFGSPEWAPIISIEEQQLPTVPEHLLTGSLGAMVREVARVTATPPELGLVVGLTCLGTANAHKFQVRVGKSLVQPLNLYCVGIMPSGSRKSPVFGAMASPIQNYQAEIREASKEVVRKSTSDYELWLERCKVLRSKVARTATDKDRRLLQEHLGTEPVVVPAPRILTSNATPESVVQMLSENQQRIAIFSAEPDPFADMMGRYSGKPNLGIYLEGHSGDSHSNDRVGRASIQLPTPLISMMLMAQPEVATQLRSDKQMRGRGLLARILWVWPEPGIGFREFIDEEVCPSVLSNYHQGMGQMLKRPVLLDALGQPLPQTITLHGESFDLWRDEYNRIEVEMRQSGTLAEIRDWAGKYPSAIARIAANLHVANGVDTGFDPATVPIPKETMRNAIEIAKVIESHSVAVLSGITPTTLSAAQRVVAKIRKNGTGQMDLRTFKRQHQWLEKCGLTDPVLRLLQDHKYLRREPSDYGGIGRPKSDLLRVNPAVFQSA